MKRRIFAGLIASAMMASMLAGCGGGAQQGGSADGGSGHKVTLIMSQRDEWLSEMEAAAQAAAKDTGINLTTQDANSDTSKMIQYIESSVTAGEDAIIINMVDPETAAQCIEAAGDVPVVFVNRFPGDPSVLNEKAVYVGSDEMTSGAFQGEFLAKFFKDQGKTDISYLMLNGILGQTSTTNRTASVLKALEDNGIKATAAAAPLAADYDRATAMDMISPLLKTPSTTASSPTTMQWHSVQSKQCSSRVWTRSPFRSSASTQPLTAVRLSRTAPSL